MKSMANKAFEWINVAPVASIIGDNDLSMSHDQKAMALLFPLEKCRISFFHRVAFIAQFDDSSPSAT